MKLVATLAAGAILAFVGTSAMAQTAAPATTAPAATTTAPAPTTTAPAATTKPATTMMKKATTATTPAKTAISKACSAQADAKGLHGKERHKFRSDCKKNGGKV
ncbi:PsiF family protein [Phyllobacterium sp. OV277]|uniref:PsiF family protein n=1 Tax=Phyllobacterium sp. OV277 TaxID=1882772 RepID=UPI00088B5ABD|nr:PsiF family protein [Phyllobacterium sp. OV277]SDN88129.1 psiF repeat-containing protein [Phyllobacterium sp. OV277]